MRVVLDGVFNHTGPRLLAVPPRPRERRRRRRTATGSTSTRRRSTGATVRPYPFATDVDEAPDEPSLQPTDDRRATRRCAAWATGPGGACPPCPSSTPTNPEVREYLLGVAEHWLRFGIDGWRLDVPAEIDDEAFWQEFRRRCRAINPEAYLVGEIWHVAPEWLARRPLRRADELPARRGDPRLRRRADRSTRALSCVPTTSTAARSDRLDGAGVRPGSSERLLGVYDPDVDATSSSTCSARTTAPRLRTMASAATAASYRLAILLQATLPGAPCIYYGDEVGLTGGNDPECRRGVPVGRERVGPRRACLDAGGVRGPSRAAGPAPRHVPRRGRDGRCAARSSARRTRATTRSSSRSTPATSRSRCPAFAPQLGGATLRDVPLPDTGAAPAASPVATGWPRWRCRSRRAPAGSWSGPEAHRSRSGAYARREWLTSRSSSRHRSPSDCGQPSISRARSRMRSRRSARSRIAGWGSSTCPPGRSSTRSAPARRRPSAIPPAEPLRIDRPDESLDAIVSLWSGFRGVDAGRARRGRPGARPGRPPARRPRLRPRRGQRARRPGRARSTASGAGARARSSGAAGSRSASSTASGRSARSRRPRRSSARRSGSAGPPPEPRCAARGWPGTSRCTTAGAVASSPRRIPRSTPPPPDRRASPPMGRSPEGPRARTPATLRGR